MSKFEFKNIKSTTQHRCLRGRVKESNDFLCNYQFMLPSTFQNKTKKVNQLDINVLDFGFLS